MNNNEVSHKVSIKWNFYTSFNSVLTIIHWQQTEYAMCGGATNDMFLVLAVEALSN